MTERFRSSDPERRLRDPVGSRLGGHRRARGRIAELGALSGASPPRRSTRAGCMSCRVSSTRMFISASPGISKKRTWRPGSTAALLGGVTAVFEMPNTNPPTTTRALIEDKLARAAQRMRCDYAFYVGASNENIGALSELERLSGVAGVKAFLGSSTGSLLLDKEEAISNALRSGRRRMAVHSEDEARLKERAKLAMPGDPRTHPVWRDAETARRSTERVLKLARAAGVGCTSSTPAPPMSCRCSRRPAISRRWKRPCRI